MLALLVVTALAAGPPDPEDGLVLATDPASGDPLQPGVAGRWPWVQPADWEGALTARGTRRVHLILVLDITNSWSQTDFARARAAATRLFDVMGTHGSGLDRLGMVTFTGPFGIEQTPLHTMWGHRWAGTRSDWSDLRTASKPGMPDPTHLKGCAVDHRLPGAFAPGDPGFDPQTHQEAGCHPNMFREYLDEFGTNHAIGLEMARRMFDERPDDDVYRALVMLTDGKPNGGRAGAGPTRQEQGYVEQRWRFVTPPAPVDVEAESVEVARDLHQRLGAHIWTVSFVTPAPFLSDVAQGDGYATVTDVPSQLTTILDHVATTAIQR